MTLIADLEQGRGGVRLSIPPRFEVGSEADDVAMLHDREGGVGWHLSRYDYHLDLRPEHQALLERDIERHARALFETYSRSLPRGGPLGPLPLRTEDPAWSPVVSVDRVRLGDHDALTVIHRMSYQPGNEMVMGHLLVPIRSGLFEVRILAPAKMTGMRESMLLAAAMSNAQGEPPEAVMKRLGQKHYDDPQHDILLPDHPLTRVRANLRALLEGGVVTITEPDPGTPPGEALLPAVGCAVTTPPRYAHVRTKRDFAQWSRLSFAGTDGVQLLSVARVSDKQLPLRGAREHLKKLAEEYARASAPGNATNVLVESRALPEKDGRAHALAYLSYEQPNGSVPHHTVFRWLVDDLGHPVMIALATEQCVPREELVADAEAVAASWRPLEEGRAAPVDEEGEEEALQVKRPWWKVW